MNRRDTARLAGRVALGAWAAFALLAAVVVGHRGVPLWPDSGLLDWSVGHRPAVAQAMARGVTDTGTGIIPYALVVLCASAVGRDARRRLTLILLGTACLAAGQALRYGVMTLVHRPRPAGTDWATHASGWSFPSGHTTTAAMTAGLLVLAVSLRAPRGAHLLRVTIGCWAVAVGLSRVYLGVHWLTDVLGGWLFATGWLAVCLWAAARMLPARVLPGTAATTPDPAEDHASQDPGR
ncbi:phosphatase PAP2 family protein [Streptomyces sp. NPDC101225]|uniref:phosphatase PAP2 family protein n=1 Tax=Streptomyces sp. NPDC101225 TaxID=3366135 RepID=UPI003827CE4F